MLALWMAWWLIKLRFDIIVHLIVRRDNKLMPKRSETYDFNHNPIKARVIISSYLTSLIKTVVSLIALVALHHTNIVQRQEWHIKSLPSLTLKGIVTTPYAPGVPYKTQMKSDK